MTDKTKESFVVLRHMLIWDLSLPGMNGRGPSCFEFFTCGRYRPRGSPLIFSTVVSVLRKRCVHFVISHSNKLRRVRKPLRVLQAHGWRNGSSSAWVAQKQDLLGYLKRIERNLNEHISSISEVSDSDSYHGPGGSHPIILL